MLSPCITLDTSVDEILMDVVIFLFEHELTYKDVRKVKVLQISRKNTKFPRIWLFYQRFADTIRSYHWKF
jgi:hypothetical protein